MNARARSNGHLSNKAASAAIFGSSHSDSSKPLGRGHLGNPIDALPEGGRLSKVIEAQTLVRACALPACSGAPPWPSV